MKSKTDRYLDFAGRAAELWMATVALGVVVFTFVVVPLLLLYCLIGWLVSGVPIENVR